MFKAKYLSGDPAQNLDLKDKKFLLKNAPIGFSPERNKQIVEATIKDYEAKLAREVKAKEEEYAERADAVTTYLKHLDMGGKGVSNLEKYFGKRELARLRGQEIREKLMAGMTVVNRQGQVIKKGASIKGL